eukprot:NODE_6_length_48303_cov_0.387022.p12 type:complete len:290 gc:universal NODE_6_length_48303_cov_0.387022:12714-11845(-)
MTFNFDDKLKIAIPKKGRLYDTCMDMLKGADIKFSKKNRLDIAYCTNLPIALIFLPAKDIPIYVADGSIHAGITGSDMVLESQVRNKVTEELRLGFGKCRLVVQVPEGSKMKIEDLNEKKIVSSFPNTVKDYFKNKLRLEINCSYVSGSVEIACQLGLADAVCDLVESGDTMKAAGLKELHTIHSSECVLIANPNNPFKDLFKTITGRIQGVIDAKKHVYCTYNVPRSSLRDAKLITPGRKAPTVSPLENEEWVSVSVMIDQEKQGDIMDKLLDVGASDILIFDIHNCR